MPDGTPFPFWDDATEYGRTYHVAREHAKAADSNPGTEELPFATIGKAAAVLQPGEKVVIHRGVYRECVRPARGGNGPDRMIHYQAAPGEDVRVRASEAWSPTFEPSSGWRLYPRDKPEQPRAWMAEFPEEWFGPYNPFASLNLPQSEYTRALPANIGYEMQKRRGMIFLDGRPLKQVLLPEEIGETDGTFWVETPSRVHIRMWDDADPNGLTFEVTTREQAFAPKEFYLGYIRVSGIAFEYGADGFPVPQKGLVSAMRGHHWILEDCRVRWANSIGIDVGNQSWHAERPENLERGGHIVRRNTVADCGVCGIAGCGNVDWSLFEDNTVENICGRDIEEFWETAGIKLHLCNSVLIRNNVIRHVRYAPGLWLDCMNHNCRITENVIADIEGINGGLYLEVSHDPNMIDHNIFWDIRVPENRHAVNIDTGEKSIVAHNLIGRVRGGHGVGADLNQADRVVDGRNGLCRQHRVLNNIFVDCPKRILFSRAESNFSDGNLFDRKDDATSLTMQFPSPESRVNLAGWQEFYGFDQHGAQAEIAADFDVEALELKLTIEGDQPQPVEVPELGTKETKVGPSYSGK